MFKKLLIPAVILLHGCATVHDLPERDVPSQATIESDSPKLNDSIEEKNIGEKENLIVHAGKRFQTLKGLKLQVWDISVENENDIGYCVHPVWQLMDFRYVSDGPSLHYVPANSVTYIGSLHQEYWIIEGTKIALEPSGFLRDLQARPSRIGVKPGEECEFIIDESQIESK